MTRTGMTHKEERVGGFSRPFFCLKFVLCCLFGHKKGRREPASFSEKLSHRSRYCNLSGTPSHSSASDGDSFFSVMFGHMSASSALSPVNSC
ncbi:hypothetical protein LCGC14_0031870 [marine sediment metagenome]|uniref:Uncharacterized protein n=1 Tax=marine sediment metagenome TaxID=412755 RepID=A0A0F9WBE9_9ZZZZ